jgi:chemotaxis protein methyltransferase CheR
MIGKTDKWIRGIFFFCSCILVYDQSSIHLGEEKKEMVGTRLHERLSHLGLDSVEKYCARLKAGLDPDEVTHLIDALSTNFTTFFREVEHFKFLKEKIIPDFCARSLLHSQGPFRAWSAACATGEEPYSLAIVLASCFQAIDPAMWQVFASDISTRVLERAREGIYEESRVKLPNPAWLARFFQKGRGDWTGHYRVKRALRDQVEFAHMNLLQPGLRMTERYHLIFCRNVMIYFDRATAELLVDRLGQHLHEGGYLVIGHVESLPREPRDLIQVKPSIYRKGPC